MEFRVITVIIHAVAFRMLARIIDSGLVGPGAMIIRCPTLTANDMACRRTCANPEIRCSDFAEDCSNSSWIKVASGKVCCRIPPRRMTTRRTTKHSELLVSIDIHHELSFDRRKIDFNWVDLNQDDNPLVADTHCKKAFTVLDRSSLLQSDRSMLW